MILASVRAGPRTDRRTGTVTVAGRATGPATTEGLSAVGRRTTVARSAKIAAPPSVSAGLRADRRTVTVTVAGRATGPATAEGLSAAGRRTTVARSAKIAAPP
ncbi:MAG: hypothetical protein GY842_01745, partial [bacterium]|nr:hypothetical protein [bacterium]